MKVSDNLYIVGGGDAGFNLSGPIDANVYALSTPTGIWLFDVGLDAGPLVIENMRADGLDPSDITHIFVTHYHADHSGALGYFRETLGDVTVATARDVAGYISTGDEVANALGWARDLGYYPKEFRLSPCNVDLELEDGFQVQSGDVTLTAVETPGHCAGHFCFHVSDGSASYLFSGDQVFVGGKILLQNVPDANLQACAASMNKLASLEFDALLPGHAGFSLSNGRRHVEAAALRFDRIGLPENLI